MVCFIIIKLKIKWIDRIILQIIKLIKMKRKKEKI